MPFLIKGRMALSRSGETNLYGGVRNVRLEASDAMPRVLATIASAHVDYSRALICPRNQVKYLIAVSVRWCDHMKLPTTFFQTSLPVAAALVLATACSPRQEGASGASATSAPVQGEPIKPLVADAELKGEPIATLAPPEASAPVAVADATATTPGAFAQASVTSDSDPKPAAEPAANVIRSGDTDYLSVGFDQLASYTFEVSDELLESKGDPKELTEKTNQQIPDTIRKLSDQSVAVKGYMLPLKVEQGAVTEFLLMRDQSMCCFGTVPKINEWVSVKTIGKGVKPVMDEPVTIFGKLHVGEMRENGYLVGIYRMDGEKLAGPLDL